MEVAMKPLIKTPSPQAMSLAAKGLQKEADKMSALLRRLGIRV